MAQRSEQASKLEALREENARLQALLGPGGEELEYDVKPPRPNKSRLSHVRTPLTKVELSGFDFVLFSRKFLWVKFHCRGVPVPPLETLRLRLRALTPMSSSTQW